VTGDLFAITLSGFSASPRLDKTSGDVVKSSPVVYSLTVMTHVNPAAWAAARPLPESSITTVSVFGTRSLMVSASSPTVADGPALFVATLSGTTASVQPVFGDQATATIANVGASQGQSTTLALTDPDSNEVVPPQSPRFGRDFVLDSQGDQQQIYLGDAADVAQDLRVLNLSQSINDTAWVTNPRGTLYVSDNASGDVVAIRGLLAPGAPYVAVTPCSANNAAPSCPANYLGTLDMYTGAVEPVQLPPGTTLKPEGLLFVSRPERP
jgi:hypothetical protein